jgi:hypothetical protein
VALGAVLNPAKQAGRYPQPYAAAGGASGACARPELAVHAAGMGRPHTEGSGAVRDLDRQRSQRRSARRRATLIADRLCDGLGWASPVRRVVHQYLAIPRGATAADASGAEIGGGPFGHGPGD